uniref:Uncharacterized protein LOC116944544 isoform X2 n=1 Tax=Petromyzon marinus TaxID=7757 RepID=A0AAJ7TC29_PETMA|nr:uncharacterized protein LOC116944544 isoform X2 [Petromyzon marinus]
MSRPGKRQRLMSAVQFCDEEDVGEGLATNPGAWAREHRPVEPAWLEREGTVAAGAAAPPPDTWRAIVGQLELLQHTLGQLVITMAEVGRRVLAPATGFDRLRWVPAGSSPGQSAISVGSSAGASLELGAMLRATPESAAMSTVMAAPMGAAAPAGTAGVSAAVRRTATPVRAAYTTAAPQLGAYSWLDAGPKATRRSDVAAAAVGTASGGAGGEYRPGGLLWGPQLRRLPPVAPFTAKGGD